MIESQIFRATGVGSRSWYISRIKIGFPAGKTGFTYLRADSGEDGKQLSFDEIKSSMSQLVAAGYVKKHGKPEAPRSDKYEVTSFGHRYLEEHKDELIARPEPKVSGAAPTGVMHEVPRGPEFTPPIPSDRKDDGVTRVAKAGISLGQEIEKHKARAAVGGTVDPSLIAPERDEPELVVPIAKANPEPAKESTPTPDPIQKAADKGNLDELTDELKKALSEMLLEKFLDKTLSDVISFKSIPIHSLLEWMESKK